MSDVQKWSLLMVSDKAGLVAEFGHDWKGHPEHYERVDVVRADLYEQQQKRIAELEAQVAKMFGELNYAELRIQDLRARNGR